MRADQLLSPGVLSNSQTLRHELAKAISYGQIQYDLSQDSDALAVLATFLADALAQVNAYIA